MKQDPLTKAGCEAATKGSVVSALGEVTTKAKVNYEQIIRGVCKDVGYDSRDKGLDYKSMSVLVVVEEQDADIARAVYENKKT